MRFEIGEVRFEAGGGKAKKILRTAFPAWVFRTYLRSVFFSKLTSHYLASNFIFVKFSLLNLMKVTMKMNVLFNKKKKNYLGI